MINYYNHSRRWGFSCVHHMRRRVQPKCGGQGRPLLNSGPSLHRVCVPCSTQSSSYTFEKLFLCFPPWSTVGYYAPGIVLFPGFNNATAPITQVRCRSVYNNQKRLVCLESPSRLFRRGGRIQSSVAPPLAAANTCTINQNLYLVCGLDIYCRPLWLRITSDW